MSARIAMLGAAPEQMAAAVRLAKAGLAVTVIEPLDRVGGRGAGTHNKPWRFDGACPWLWGMEPDGPMGRFLDQIDMAVPVFEVHEAVSLRCGGHEYSVDQADFADAFGHGFQALWADLLHFGPVAQDAFTEAVAVETFAPSTSLSAILQSAAPNLPDLAAASALQALEEKGQLKIAGAAMLDALCQLLVGASAAHTPLPIAAAAISTLAQTLNQPPDGVGGFLAKLAGVLDFHNGRLLLNTVPTSIKRQLSGWAITLADGSTLEADVLGTGRDLARFFPAFDQMEAERLDPLVHCPHTPSLATLQLGVADTTTDEMHPWSIAAAPHTLLSLQTEGFAPESFLAATATFCPAFPNDSDEQILLANLQHHTPVLTAGPATSAPVAHAHADAPACIAPDGATPPPPGIFITHIPSLMGRDLSFSLHAACCAAARLARAIG